MNMLLPNRVASLSVAMLLMFGLSGCSSSDDNNDAVLSDAPSLSVLDFESLTPNAFIHEQDNWIDYTGSGQAVVSLDSGNVNASQFVEPLLTTAFNAPVYLSRQNDLQFSFSGFSSTETDDFVQFDLTAEGSVMMALGRDINDDGMLTASDGEIGPGLGIVNGRFRMQGAAQGQLHEADTGLGNAVSDWYQLRLNLDIKPSTGGISGSLYYRNLTRGDLTHQPIEGLQAVDLESERLHSDANAEAWNSIWVYLQSDGGRTPGIDNLVPHGKQE